MPVNELKPSLWIGSLLVFLLWCSGNCCAQSPPNGTGSGNDNQDSRAQNPDANPPSTDTQDSSKDSQLAERTKLVLELRDAYWAKNDKRGQKRKAEPRLFEAHEQMTRDWVAKLDAAEMQILQADPPPETENKRFKELHRDYSRKSLEVAQRLTIARRLIRKIIKSHWDGLAPTGVLPTTFPEYTREYETTVETWFLERSLEDLKIFEKSRPSESERERGDKITAELIEKIDAVKQKFEGNMR